MAIMKRCGFCGRRFSSHRLYDEHRIWIRPNPRCLTDEELVAAGMGQHEDGKWYKRRAKAVIQELQ